ncbi:histone-like nucleoid-structuring protein Lsr2 [Rhodococcoides yunnanense]|uniref:Lsr2 family protein n=1 Tax=Rhodococcoides yunnanense TaxID=278209 RepID=A0ABU4BKB6_9NOCA|nr:Lsr2 family protein [Rhodococcus yunnanensis]MDV6264659.1 Lsr2 family protein [Rhodococcus yunnanensis]
MAKRVTTQLVDDIDGSVIDDESGETIEFAIDGVEYSIDLKAKNANEFHKKLDYSVGHATRVGGRTRTATPAAAAAAPAADGSGQRDREQTRAIRQWAFDQGYEISERGRIPANIEEAYNAAH